MNGRMNDLKRLRRNSSLLAYGLLTTLDAASVMIGIQSDMSREEIESIPMVEIAVERDLEEQVLYGIEILHPRSTRPIRNFIYWVYSVD